jgi:aspartyl-tRNA(Asn)/glutamyl-tRNA(Gln) amidotransferase subunit A
VRTVEDAALFLEVLAGWDEADPDSARVPAGRYVDGMARQMTGMRVGRLSGDFFDSDLDPAVQRALDDVTRALEEGASVTPVVLKTLEPGLRAQLTLLLAEAAAFHRATFPGREAGYGPDVRHLLDQGAATPKAELEAARSAMRELQHEVQAVMNEYPIFFGPAMPAGAPRIADADPGSDRWPEIRRMLARFSRLYNATGLPAIVLPAGVDADGLPVAVQLGAGPFQEGLLLSVAWRVEQAIGWTLPELPGVAASRRRSLS